MIRYRNGAYEVVIHAGKNPLTGKPVRVSRSVRMAEKKRTPPEVLALEARLRNEVGEGNHRVGGAKVGDLMESWLATQRNRRDLSPSSVSNYEGYAKRYVIPALGNQTVAGLQTVDLDRYYRRLEGQGLAPATIRLIHAVIRRALRYAVREGYATRNVALEAEVPSAGPSPVSAPTEAVVEKVLTCPDPDLSDLILTAVVTGARRGELCGLQWRDLAAGDLVVARAVIYLDGQMSVRPTKTGKVRRIALGPGLSARLAARKARLGERAERFGTVLSDDAFVFSDEVDGSKPLRPQLASDRFAAHCKKLGVTCHLHMLRHYAASHAVASGADVNAVASYLGHQSAKMTLDVYGHARPAALAHVTASLDRG